MHYNKNGLRPLSYLIEGLTRAGECILTHIRNEKRRTEKRMDKTCSLFEGLVNSRAQIRFVCSGHPEGRKVAAKSPHDTFRYLQISAGKITDFAPFRHRVCAEGMVFKACERILDFGRAVFK